MEMFIGKVHTYPCLWDMNSQTYRDANRKNLAWKIVAKECGLTNADEAKTQWKRLRDSHREALRRRKCKTGPATLNNRPWKYEQEMEFLLPQSTNREHCSNSNEDLNESTQDVEDPFENTTSTTQRSPSEDRSLSIQTTNENTNIRKVLEDMRREQRRQRRENERNALIMQIIDEQRQKSIRDPLTDLFSSLCEKTRSLPRYLQLRVQREIFDSVTRAEEEVCGNDDNQSIT